MFHSCWKGDNVFKGREKYRYLLPAFFFLFFFNSDTPIKILKKVMDSMGHQLVSLPTCPLSRIRSCPGPLVALSSSLFPSSILPVWALSCQFLPAALYPVPFLPGCEKWVDSALTQLVTVSAPGSRGWSGLVST